MIKQRRPLRPHQKDIFRYTGTVKHPALFVEMRLGKTLVAIRRILTYEDCRNILIVAPYSALDGWKRELQLEGQQYIIQLFGTREERLEVLQSSRAIHAPIALEFFPELVQHKTNPDAKIWYLLNKEGHLSLPELTHYSWDVVVLDESTFIKSPRSKVSKFFVKHFRETKHRWILTGTPAPESELEYYQQLAFLSCDIWYEHTYWDFRYSNFLEYDYKFLLKYNRRHYVYDVLARYCYFLKRSDVKLGGEKIYEVRTVQLRNRFRKVYNKIAELFILEYKDINKETIFATQKFHWMRRLLGGFIDGEYANKDKLEALVDILKEEIPKEQVIIWCQYIEEINIIAETLKKIFKCKVGSIYGDIDITRRNNIKRGFQSGRIKYIIAQPETFKYGTDLSAATIMVYYSTPCGLETRLQSEDRVIDVALTDSVLVIDLVYENTIDVDLLESLQRKEKNQERARRVVRGIQKCLKKYSK